MNLRTYSELLRCQTFEERFAYLMLRGDVGRSTFGFDRWMNQKFYASTEWRNLRNHVIVRDGSSDLACDDRMIYGRLLVHHMNPVVVDDLTQGNPDLLNPDFLITTCHATHNAIHYGDESLLAKPFAERRPGDTDLWRRTR